MGTSFARKHDAHGANALACASDSDRATTVMTLAFSVPSSRMPHDDEHALLARDWLRAAAMPQVALALESIYAYVAAEIESRGPACWASGRCCNFAKTGHRLYVTGLEAAYAVHNLARGRDDESRGDVPLTMPTLTASALNDARQRGDCPFLVKNLCGIHTIKPLGCRVYFCDRSAQEWQHALSERALERLRVLHDTHAITYRYGEWRAMLEMFVRERA